MAFSCTFLDARTRAGLLGGSTAALGFPRGPPGYLAREIVSGRESHVTTAEQPPPEGDEQPPQATDDEEGSDVESTEPSSTGSDAPTAGE